MAARPPTRGVAPAKAWRPTGLPQDVSPSPPCELAERALHEYGDEVAPVLGGGTDVRRRLGLLQAACCRGLDIGRAEARPGKSLGGGPCVARTIGDSAEPDANPSPAPVGRGLAGGGNADDSEVAMAPRMFDDDRLGTRAVGKRHRLEHLR